MKSAKIINFVDSSKNKITPFSIDSVKINGFMGEYLEKMLKVTILSQYEMLEKVGTIDNFLIVSGKKKGSFKGMVFSDSDVYKWLEASSYALLFSKDQELKEKVDKTCMQHLKKEYT